MTHSGDAVTNYPKVTQWRPVPSARIDSVEFKALRFLGRELLLLRDAHAREEAAAAAAASDAAALRADLEAARSERAS